MPYVVPILTAAPTTALPQGIDGGTVLSKLVRTANIRVVTEAVGAALGVRLWFYDSAIRAWTASQKAADTIDPAVDNGRAELRYAVGAIPAYVVLVRESGAGTGTFDVYSGYN